jgi:hypothetical protein
MGPLWPLSALTTTSGLTRGVASSPNSLSLVAKLISTSCVSDVVRWAVGEVDSHPMRGGCLVDRAVGPVRGDPFSLRNAPASWPAGLARPPRNRGGLGNNFRLPDRSKAKARIARPREGGTNGRGQRISRPGEFDLGLGQRARDRARPRRPRPRCPPWLK